MTKDKKEPELILTPDQQVKRVYDETFRKVYKETREREEARILAQRKDAAEDRARARAESKAISDANDEGVLTRFLKKFKGVF